MQNDFPDSLRRAELAAGIAEVNGDFAGMVSARRLTAQALRGMGRHEEALAAMNSAAHAASEWGDARLEAQVQIGAIDSLGILGRADEAFRLARKLETVLRANDSLEDAAKVLTNAGTLHYRRDEYRQASACFERAMQILPAASITALAQIQANYASVLTETGEFEKGLALFEQARQGFEAAGMPRMAAMVDANAGWLRHTSGAYAAALAALTRALRAFVESGQAIEAAKCDADRAEAYRELRLDAEALECYERALPALQKFGLTYEQGRALVGSASVLARLRRYEEAHKALDAAEILFQAQRNRMRQAHLRLARAELFRAKGEMENAKAEAAKAAQGFARCHSGYAAEARFLMAEADLETNPNDEKAARALMALRKAAAQSGRRWLACRIERVLGLYWLRQGQTNRALRHFRAGVERLDAARNLIAAEDLHTAFLQDKFAIYEDAITTLLARGTAADCREALNYAEGSRSRLLLERMQTAAQAAPSLSTLSESGAALPGPEDAGLTALRAEISRAYYRMNALDDTPPRRFAGGLPSETAEIARLETAYRARLRESEMLDAAPDCGPAFAAESFSRQAAQKALLPDETLIEYYVTAQTVSAFALTRSGLQAIPHLAGTEEVQAASRRLRFQLQRVETQPGHVRRYAVQMQEAIDDALQNLYNLLLRPLESFLRPKLVFAPHGILHGLPFHAFHDGAGYTVEKFETVYTPSAAIFHAGRRRVAVPAFCAENAPIPQPLPPHAGEWVARWRLEGRRSDAPLFALGCAEPNIARVTEEIHCLAALFPGARVFTGSAATLEAFRVHAPGCRRVHLATHALFRADNPLFSGLQCADGWLMAHDLYGMTLDCELATLSACRTGAARVEVGDELFGLIRGFLSAGARSVAASLWAADDAAAAELMAGFYGRMAQGHSRAAALREAQNELRASRPHPYYWAAFMLTGER